MAEQKQIVPARRLAEEVPVPVVDAVESGDDVLDLHYTVGLYVISITPN